MLKYVYERYSIGIQYVSQETGNTTVIIPKGKTVWSSCYLNGSGYNYGGGGNTIEGTSGDRGLIGRSYMVSFGYKVRLESYVSSDGSSSTFSGIGYSVVKQEVKGAFLGQVEAEDGEYPDNGIKDGYWWVKVGLVYIPPVISGQDSDLGLKDSSFDVKYTITCDNPGINTFTVEERLDDLVIRKFEATKNISYSFAVQDSKFYMLDNGQHVLTIKVIDNGKTIIRQYTFNKNETSIDLQLSKIIGTDTQAKTILLVPEWQGIENNTVKVEVCNNAYDLTPSWEDVTEFIKNGKEYVFTNKTKTADKWGVNIKFTCNRTVPDSTILLRGFKADITM